MFAFPDVDLTLVVWIFGVIGLILRWEWLTRRDLDGNSFELLKQSK